MNVSLSRNLRSIPWLLLAAVLGVILFPFSPASAKNKADKDKPEKPKKEKPEVWVEVRTSHFIVASDAGEASSRRVADQFEQVRGVFQGAAMPNARLDTGIPIRILAVKDAAAFAKLLPEFPVDKRREPQPSGFFVAGPEKLYRPALRMGTLHARGSVSGHLSELCAAGSETQLS